MTKSHNNQKKRKRGNLERKITIDALKTDKIVIEIIEMPKLILIKNKNKLKNRPSLLLRKLKKTSLKKRKSKAERKRKLMRMLKKIKRKAKKKAKKKEKKRRIKKRIKKRLSKSVDLLTQKKIARAGAISISASCSFSKIKSKRNRKARRSMSKHSNQSLFAFAMMSS